MKTFQKFCEDVETFRKSLSAIEKQDAPKTRLAARRKQALQQSKSAGDEFNQRTAAEVNAKKEK